MSFRRIFGKNLTNTKLSNGFISDSFYKKNTDPVWNYVYFGNYKGTALKWRVMSKSTNDFSVSRDSKTLFLDCDTVIAEQPFNTVAKTLNKNYFADNRWVDSLLFDYLNGDFAKELNTYEENAVTLCTKRACSGKEEPDGYNFDSAAGRFFVLDVSETEDLQGSKALLKKYNNNYHSYWLRSFGPDKLKDLDEGFIVDIKNNGRRESEPVITKVDKLQKSGVSPCCNIAIDRILFSTKIDDHDFKLTILADESESYLDYQYNNKTITSSSGKYIVPYQVHDNDSARMNTISILILNKPFSRDTIGKETKLLHYEKLRNLESNEKKGTVVFKLPEGFSIDRWGEDFFVYLFAEQWNGATETDYASYPLEIKAVDLPGNSYTVKYYIDAASTTPYYTQKVLKGKCAKKPSDPNSEDYFFSYWTTSIRSPKEYDFSTPILKNLKLYAIRRPASKYNLWIGDKQVTEANEKDVFGDGKVSYDRKSKTLTFKNATIKNSYKTALGDDYMLITDEDLNIKGKVSFASDKAYGGIRVNNKAALSLDAVIDIKAKAVGIYGNKAGTIKLGDDLDIFYPLDGYVGTATVDGNSLETIVDRLGEVTDEIRIDKAKRSKELRQLFELGDGLSYSRARYEHIYQAAEIKPSIVIYNKREAMPLREGVDYTVKYTNNINVSKDNSPAVATIAYMGKYEGSSKLYFYILPKEIGDGKTANPAEGIIMSEVTAVRGKSPNPVMFYNGHRLTTSEYILNSNIKDNTVTISGKGNYSGSIKDVEVTTLNSSEAEKTKIKAMFAFTYDGQPKTFPEGSFVVRDGEGNTLDKSKYKITYVNNINVGTAKAIITPVSGSGLYGAYVVRYAILPRPD